MMKKCLRKQGQIPMKDKKTNDEDHRNFFDKA